MRSWFLAFALVVGFFTVYSGLAYAATGDVCATADPTHYSKVATTTQCKMLCDGISQGVGQTSCGPIYFPDQNGCTTLVCKIGKAQTNCITSADIKIRESESSTTALPNVWTTVGTITGVVDPLVQSLNFDRPPLGAVYTTFTAMADVDCTDVDITCSLICPHKQR